MNEGQKAINALEALTRNYEKMRLMGYPMSTERVWEAVERILKPE